MKKVAVVVVVLGIISCSRPLSPTLNVDEIMQKVEYRLDLYKLDSIAEIDKEKQEKSKYTSIEVGDKSINAFDADDFDFYHDNIIYTKQNKLCYLIGKTGKKFCVNSNEKILYGYYKNGTKKEIYILTNIKKFSRNVLGQIQIEDENVYFNRINSELSEYDYVREVGIKTDNLNNIGYISEKIYACYIKKDADVFEVHLADK